MKIHMKMFKASYEKANMQITLEIPLGFLKRLIGVSLVKFTPTPHQRRPGP